ncbi:hypothetical protein [Cobetia sp. ICG0124]|uniref:hypothetical protein n=1 Tax=Cobetia sp. ICG0124 TaxID=2053669 RepID=UPI000FDC61A4|nr:hypothetical protein [Cobetia sp. ICG0124]AZV31171.1 hypothetical protein CU110_07070 [Cobetia sp. ICG0124]
MVSSQRRYAELDLRQLQCVAGEAFDHLAVGESLVLDYTVVVTDSQGVTAEQVVSDHHQRQQRCAGHCHRRRRQRGASR